MSIFACFLFCFVVVSKCRKNSGDHSLQSENKQAIVFNFQNSKTRAINISQSLTAQPVNRSRNLRPQNQERAQNSSRSGSSGGGGGGGAASPGDAVRTPRRRRARRPRRFRAAAGKRTSDSVVPGARSHSAGFHYSFA